MKKEVMKFQPTDKKDLFSQADLPRYINTQVTFCLQPREAEASSGSFSENKHNIFNGLAPKLNKLVAEQGKTFCKRNTLLVI